MNNNDSSTKALLRNIITAIALDLLIIGILTGGFNISSGFGMILIYVLIITFTSIFSLFTAGLINFIIYKKNKKENSARISLFVIASSIFILTFGWLILVNS